MARREQFGRVVVDLRVRDRREAAVFVAGGGAQQRPKERESRTNLLPAQNRPRAPSTLVSLSAAISFCHDGLKIG